MNELIYKTVLTPLERKGRTTFRRVYYHPKTGYQIAVVTRFYLLLPEDRTMPYWDRYWVSFPNETPNAFTFRVGSLDTAERMIKSEYSLIGKWVNRVQVTLANARLKLPKYWE